MNPHARKEMGKSAPSCYCLGLQNVRDVTSPFSTGNRLVFTECEEKEVNRLLSELDSIIPIKRAKNISDSLPSTSIVNSAIEYIRHLENQVGHRNVAILKDRLSFEMVLITENED